MEDRAVGSITQQLSPLLDFKELHSKNLPPNSSLKPQTLKKKLNKKKIKEKKKRKP